MAARWMKSWWSIRSDTDAGGRKAFHSSSPSSAATSPGASRKSSSGRSDRTPAAGRHSTPPRQVPPQPRPGLPGKAAADDQIGRRRQEGIPLLLAKFRRNLARGFPEKQQRTIAELSLDRARLEQMPVNEYVDLYVI